MHDLNPDALNDHADFLLAQQLQLSDDATLIRHITALGHNRSRQVRDYFDLATALLEPVYFRSRLQAADRLTLCALHTLSQHPEGLEESDFKAAVMAQCTKPQWLDSSLADEQVTAALQTLTTRALAWQSQGHWHTTAEATAAAVAVSPDAPKLPLLSPDWLLSNPPAERNAAAAAESLIMLTELLSLIRETPVRLRQNGAPLESEVKRVLAAFPEIPEKERSIRRLLDFLHHSSLTVSTAGELALSPEGKAFLQLEQAAKLEGLFKQWLELVPPALLSLLAAVKGLSAHFSQSWAWLLPLQESGTLPEALSTVATLFGIADERGQVPAPLTMETLSELASQISAVLPETGEQIYLQADLSAIAPTPLHPSLDFELRRYADREGYGLIAQYRFSNDALNRAWRQGGTAGDLLEILERISLSGVPESFRLLVESSYELYTSLQLREAADGSSVLTGDPHRIEELSVDVKLRRFRMLPALTSGRLLSSAAARDLEEGLWAAGYPVQFIETPTSSEAEEMTATAAPKNLSNPPTFQPEPAPFAQQLVERLRSEQAQPLTEQQWIFKTLQELGGLKTAVHIKLIAPDGQPTTLTALPVNVSAQRLRVVDVVSETERTIPMKNILSVSFAKETSSESALPLESSRG